MAKQSKGNYRAQHRYARISARKVRFVIDAVRGLPVNDALVQLRFIRRRASPMVEKVIRSAMANAQQAGEVDLDKLRVAEVYCDEGPTLKRWRPRAMGRVYSILKRTSHISVVLQESGEESQENQEKS
jgi:large subunit ribosomal protein L22